MCTNNSTIQRVGEERDVHFFACKKIGLYEYMVAERYSDDHNTNIKYIERKNEKESEKKELSTEYPILKAVFSPDGKYIALAFDCEKENFLLLKIDSVSNGVIQKEKYLNWIQEKLSRFFSSNHLSLFVRILK